MRDSSPKKALSTTPADLEAGIDAAIVRCFGGVDESAEARMLGVPEDVVRDLRKGLLELRDVAARARSLEEPRPGLDQPGDD
jgi:hypothetical protein